MKPLLDINQVLNYLPQRPPFLFIDKVVAIEEKKSLTAIKNVTMNEPFFAGHFPNRPIMPGVLIIEALAQAAVVFAFYSIKEDPAKSLFLFAGVDNARFKRPVVPGDVLQLKIELLKIRHDVWKVQGTATVEGELVCTAELMSVKKEVARDDS
ncbi:MAG: 3-hydroxyacyl-[acyl-carrier-protein] dehydratase FabZ [Gammaproteobacteria bacterium RIFCSPHIGHO2_12_FULL_35_23]|nr:MAG: 3-hydroxyacyl-[acyl-carrier-protein] dehydratase FabZ [Gammaproteobacteria bacterium RIFCSPHIGHO2_12_FULL_35_23]